MLLKGCKVSDSMGLRTFEMSNNCSAFHTYLPNVTFITLPRLGFHADLRVADSYICNIRKQTHMLPQAFWERELCLYLLLKRSVLATAAWLVPLSGVAQLMERHHALTLLCGRGGKGLPTPQSCPPQLPSCYSGLPTWGAACSAVQINGQCKLPAERLCVFAYAQNYLFPLQFLSLSIQNWHIPWITPFLVNASYKSSPQFKIPEHLQP